MGVFRLHEYICANKNKGKYFLAFEVAEQFSAEICLVTLCYFKAYETKSQQGNNRGKTPIASLVIHAVSRMGSHFFRILGVRKFRYVGI